MRTKERAIAGALLLAILGSGLFIASYVTSGDRLYEGLSLALLFAALCAAALGWAFWVVPHERVTDEISTYPSTEEDRQAEAGEIATDVREVSRSRALVRLLYLAVGSMVAALVVPIRSLGPSVDGVLFHTKWRKGDRIIRADGHVMRVSDLNVDSAVTIFPEGALGDPQSQAVLIRLPLNLDARTKGYIAYSKVCPHAGCPVALYRASAKQLMCPCHQSVFDIADDGAVVAGPADHALPRLPIEVSADGTLRATGDFPEPVGPGFWERG